MTQIHLARPAARLILATALMLLVPLVAMQFTDEVAWDLRDFLAAAALLLGSGMAYVLAARRARRSRHRVAIGVLVFVVLAGVWAELAVGLVG